MYLITFHHCGLKADTPLQVVPQWSQLIVALAPPHRCFLIMDRPVWTSSNPSFSSSTHIPSHRCTIPRPIPCSIPSLMAPCWARAAAWPPNKLCPPPSLDRSSPRPLPHSHTQGEYGHGCTAHLKASLSVYIQQYLSFTHATSHPSCFGHIITSFCLAQTGISPCTIYHCTNELRESRGKKIKH